jgi:hypothetical protein
MKQVGWNNLYVRQFTAENFRHNVGNSDKGNQPGENRGNPPPHNTLPYPVEYIAKNSVPGE